MSLVAILVSPFLGRGWTRSLLKSCVFISIRFGWKEFNVCTTNLLGFHAHVNRFEEALKEVKIVNEC